MAQHHSTSPQNARDFEEQVVQKCQELGLRVYRQAKMGTRIWGAKRKVDIVVEHPQTRKRLGIECKYQKKKGTAEQKIYATLEDMKAWPIRGIVVVGGEGFSEKTLFALMATGNVIHINDLEQWLRFFFGMDI